MPCSPALPDQLPTVTVVIPTIGRPKYIADTVRSVLLQDYPQLRVLISDNVPATPTAQVLRESGIDDPRIRIVARQERLPFSAHMNACLKDSDGDFVMILSDDDQLSRGYISEQVSLFTHDPKVTVGFGQQTVATETQGGLLDTQVGALPSRVLDGADFLAGSLSGSLRTGVMTYISLFARRSDLIRVGGFKLYPDGSHADNFIVWQLALAGRVALGKQVMHYRVYATSHGLSTPFSALLAATSAYTRDCAAALRKADEGQTPQEHALIRQLKLNNFRMLRSRLRTVYRQRLSMPALARAMISTLLYALTPVRWL